MISIIKLSISMCSPNVNVKGGFNYIAKLSKTINWHNIVLVITMVLMLYILSLMSKVTIAIYFFIQSHNFVKE